MCDAHLFLPIFIKFNVLQIYQQFSHYQTIHYSSYSGTKNNIEITKINKELHEKITNLKQYNKNIKNEIDYDEINLLIQ